MLPCPRCNKEPTISFCGVGYTIACSDCYDYAPDEIEHYEIGHGKYYDEAIESWNNAVEERV